MQRHDNNKKPIRLPKVVAEIGKLNLDGNIIPHSWYEHIKLASGATDLVGIIILSEIVYWYRPYELLAERSGQPSYHKKFAGDMFQSAAGYYEQKFGLTKDQTRKALKRLEDNGLIRREYREVVQRGVRMNNVMFIEPVPVKIAEITYSALESDTQADTPPVLPVSLVLVPKDADALIFDYALKDLSEAQRNPIRQKLAGVSMPLAQHILDELNSNVGQGAVKARKPYLRYLDKLIARATGNDLEPFVPTSDLPDRRRKAAAIEHAKAESERKALEKLHAEDQETEPKRNPSAGSGRRGPPGGSIKAMLAQERLKNAK